MLTSGFKSLNGLAFEVSVFLKLAEIHLNGKKRSYENAEDATNPVIEKAYRHTIVMSGMAGALRKVFEDSHHAVIHEAGKTPSAETIETTPLFEIAPALVTHLLERTDQWLEAMPTQWLDSPSLKSLYFQAAQRAGQNQGYRNLLENPDARLALMRRHGAKALPDLLSPAPKG